MENSEELKFFVEMSAAVEEVRASLQEADNLCDSQNFDDRARSLSRLICAYANMSTLAVKARRADLVAASVAGTITSAQSLLSMMVPLIVVEPEKTQEKQQLMN